MPAERRNQVRRRTNIETFGFHYWANPQGPVRFPETTKSSTIQGAGVSASQDIAETGKIGMVFAGSSKRSVVTKSWAKSVGEYGSVYKGRDQPLAKS